MSFVIKQQSIKLANVPTPIEKLNNDFNGHSIYVKRDDLTGMEISGNKVRKLEFLIQDALSQNADVIITCGGIQSNHARATAIAAAKVGLKSHLVLATDHPVKTQGNVFLDKLFDAHIERISYSDYTAVLDIMQSIKNEYAKNGKNAYIIPTGGSNALGNLGYINGYNEILEQEQVLGVNFDVIVCTVGSGGTYSGLLLGNHLNKMNKAIIGFNISADAEYFKHQISRIANQTLSLLDKDEIVTPNHVSIIDGFVGRGYALSSEDEIEFIKQSVKKYGIIFDPVYTGKAFRGLIKTLENTPQSITQKKNANILFIHTGGLFAIFDNTELFIPNNA